MIKILSKVAVGKKTSLNVIKRNYKNKESNICNGDTLEISPLKLGKRKMISA